MALLLVVSSIYVDVTIPAGQLNESLLGYTMSVGAALLGWVFFAIYRMYRNHQQTSGTRQ